MIRWAMTSAEAHLAVDPIHWAHWALDSTAAWRAYVIPDKTEVRSIDQSINQSINKIILFHQIPSTMYVIVFNTQYTHCCCCWFYCFRCFFSLLSTFDLLKTSCSLVSSDMSCKTHKPLAFILTLKIWIIFISYHNVWRRMAYKRRRKQQQQQKQPPHNNNNAKERILCTTLLVYLNCLKRNICWDLLDIVCYVRCPRWQ